ncbi:hypothetical protein AB0J37_04475 [Microbispora rosea]|uniref:hypothetical protein n=1 Tax=Microbispora rosea TaxID=58117 RepID=UPI0034216D55
MATLIATAMLGLTAAVPAHAEPQGDGMEQAPFKNPAGHFCVNRLPKKTAPRTKVHLKPTCYQTATEAIKDATGGKITDAPVDGKGIGSPEFVAKINAYNESARRDLAAGQAANILVAALFQLEYYEGEVDYYTSPDPCNGWAWDIDLYGDWWDNRTSSVQMYNNCAAILYQFSFYGDTYYVSTNFYEPYLGDFDNRTTSLQIL